MTTAHALLGELAHHQFLKEELRRRFPDEDEQALADTLEGESSLNECLAEVARSIADDAAMAQACKIREADLATRRKRHEDRVEAKRNLIAMVMDRAGLPRIVVADVTLSLSDAKTKVVVDDEANLPDVCLKEKTSYSPDKDAITEFLRSGPISGAHMSNGNRTLTVRTK